MTISELHIDFETKLNRLAGEKFLGFSREEMDWYLNEAMYLKIYKVLNRKQNKTQEDLFDTKEKVSDLEALFTSASLPLFKVNNSTGSSLLPPDFLHLLEANALVNASCNFVDNTTVAKSIQYFSVAFPFNVFIGSWTVSAITSLGTTQLFTLTNLHTGIALNTDFSFVYIQRILQYVNKNVPNYKVYWENYDSIYKPNQLIFVYTGNQPLTSATSVLNGTTTTPPITTYSKEQVTYTGNVKEAACRVESNEMAGSVSNNPFYKSRKESPVIFFFNGTLLLKITDFNVNGLNITYIRKPLVINSTSNQSIELGSMAGNKYKICQEIVDIAVANAAARLSIPNFQILDSKTE